MTSLKGKSHFAFNTHYHKKSVKIKSLVEQGAIPLDITVWVLLIIDFVGFYFYSSNKLQHLPLFVEQQR